MKDVDRRSMDLVTGYIRLADQELKNDLIIPSLVITTCISFYHLGEIFTVYGRHMTVDQSSKGLEMKIKYGDPKGRKRSTAYGNIAINDT